MDGARKFVTGPTPHEASRKTSEVIVAFARLGVAMETISRALVVSVGQVNFVCGRAVEQDTLQMLPPVSSGDARGALHTEIANLRHQLELAQAALKEAKDSESLNPFVGVAGLTGREARLVNCLVRRGRVSKMDIFGEVYRDRFADEYPAAKIVDVFVCKIRKKLARLGVTVETLWGQGYAMTTDSVAKMREAERQLNGRFRESPSIVPTANAHAAA